MYHDHTGKSPTQFNVNTAKALQRKGLVTLTYVAEVGSNIVFKLELK